VGLDFKAEMGDAEIARPDNAASNIF